MGIDASHKIALAHDYLTQRGGAERVVLALVSAFPDAPLYTSLYDPAGTFPEFAIVDVRPLPMNALTPLRHRHRLALPLLAPAFSRLQIAADVVICSSSGWAHGAHSDGRKIVYCHAPARWLYQTDRYLGDSGRLARIALAAMHPLLERWDRRAASTADCYLANSSWIARQIEQIYGLEAEVLHPPTTIDALGPQRRVMGVEPGYVLCVSRLLPYKNVEMVVSGVSRLPDVRLVIVGEGPDEARLRSMAEANVHFVGSVDDAELRWLYDNARCLVAASYEDFGLTPLEAAAFGRPTAALRFGGFLDTVREGETGVFFELPEPASIGTALKEILGLSWDEAAIRLHAASFSREHFIGRIRQVTGKEPAEDGSAVEPPDSARAP